MGPSGRSRGHPTTPWDKAERAEEPGREHDCRGPDGPQQMESRTERLLKPLRSAVDPEWS